MLHKVILKTKIYSCILITFSGIIAMLACVLAGQVSDYEVKIYGTLYAITAFIFMAINIYVFYRLQTINLINAEINNSNCFSSWNVLYNSILNNSDLWFSKYVLKCLVVILFHSTLSFITRLKYHNDTFEFTQNISISIVLFIVMFILGFLLQFYLVMQLIQMLADFKDYSKEIVFTFHIKETLQEEKQYKSGITMIAMIFMLGSIAYYAIKLALYILIAKNNEEINTKVFSIIVSILNVSCIILCASIYLQLKSIYHQIPDIQDVTIYSYNIPCFTGWFILVRSLVFSNKFRFWRNITFILLYIQTIYGLIKFPFYKIYDVTIEQMFSLESYLYCDTAIIVALMFWQFIEQFARVIHQVKRKYLAYQFEDQSQNNILPVSIDVQTEELGRIQNQSIIDNLVENAQQDYGECCFCLDQISKGQRVHKLKCHATHIFHYYCMSKWLANHNNCPLCQYIIN
ncbi:unnamed protein product (macronuclear) [Paramecium tetraurelia]|uniref:RING-type domain-containing protein n=1 Tax=Paramecium tetraurelia TaxID=5888 RepID=A0BQV5_PARTE|nr:uncharacterized protein GSPATT00031151001 [Paramecium tetraurelia]CAK60922.1 unnamed protein product [Paramecium tetraurelia]|eukprot:XP_001428320.1 hypothetical protein (macronuclear) [Paramecium tetraurelia strain d4-2]